MLLDLIRKIQEATGIQNLPVGIKWCVLVLVFIGVWMLVDSAGGVDRKRQRIRLAEKAKQDGCTVTGYRCSFQIVNGDDEAKTRYGRACKVFAAYKYTVNGVEYKKKCKFTSSGPWLPEVPTKTTIYYDRDDPRRSVSMDSDYANMKRLCFLFASLATIATIFLIGGI